LVETKVVVVVVVMMKETKVIAGGVDTR